MQAWLVFFIKRNKIIENVWDVLCCIQVEHWNSSHSLPQPCQSSSLQPWESWEGQLTSSHEKPQRSGAGGSHTPLQIFPMGSSQNRARISSSVRLVHVAFGNMQGHPQGKPL